jgi:hypothetical protein
MNAEVNMFYYRRVFASLLVTIVVALTIVLAHIGGVVMAQEGISEPSAGDTAAGTESPRFVGADSGMPAFYACLYGHWGCAESAAPVTFVGADKGMPAFYACQYGHWGCAESADPVTFVGADKGTPAFYACLYGHWGCQ